METEKILYVRTDYKIDGKLTSKSDFDDHIKYLNSVAKERFFMGGGFNDRTGGMIVFEASDIDEARKISDNDPVINRGLYRYELVEWEMVLLSKELRD